MHKSKADVDADTKAESKVVVCPLCRHIVHITEDGRLFKHHRLFSYKCGGSGKSLEELKKR